MANGSEASSLKLAKKESGYESANRKIGVLGDEPGVDEWNGCGTSVG